MDPAFFLRIFMNWMELLKSDDGCVTSLKIINCNSTVRINNKVITS